MPEKSRRKRLRLSFIGGRRPSRLPPIKKTFHGKEKEVEKSADVNTEKNVVVDECVNVNTEENVVDECVNVNTEEVTVEEKKESSQRNANEIVNIDEKKEVVARERKQIRQNKKKTKQEDTHLKALHELKELTEQLDHQIVGKSSCVGKIDALRNELQKWKDFLVNSEVNIEIPEDIKAAMSLDISAEVSKMQSWYDELCVDAVEIKFLHDELHEKKEAVQKELDNRLNDIQVDVGATIETPRHLIKKMVN